MSDRQEQPIPRSRREVEGMLRELEEQPNEPDPLTNAERRRVLLWVLGREEESEQVEDKSDSLRGVF